MGRKRIDRSGQVFGQLKVVSHCSGYDWNCICNCGNTTVVHYSNLVGGQTKSCGCLQKKDVSERFTTHGFTRHRRPTPTYRAWVRAKARCTNPNEPEYQYYGGRGIQMLFASVEDLIAEIGERPDDRDENGRSLWSIDRINNDGHYEPGNVRWATRSQQASNQQRRRQKTPV